MSFVLFWSLLILSPFVVLSASQCVCCCGQVSIRKDIRLKGLVLILVGNG